MTALDRIEELAQKATPGPRRADGYGVRNDGGYICALMWASRYEGQEARFQSESEQRQADADLIAALSREFVLAMVECIRALEFYSKRSYWMQLGESGPHKLLIASGDTDSSDGWAVADAALAKLEQMK